MICFHCGKDIGVDDKRIMVGLDIPYINLFFHRIGCWEIANNPEIDLYLVQNSEKIYNYCEKDTKKGRK